MLLSKLFKKEIAVKPTMQRNRASQAFTTIIILGNPVGYCICIQTVMSLLDSHRKGSVEDHHLVDLHHHWIGSAGICGLRKNSLTITRTLLHKCYELTDTFTLCNIKLHA